MDKWIKYLPSLFKYHKKIKYDSFESLSYVTPYKQANMITRWIEYMICEFIGSKKSILLIESCGGLGGNTISFGRSICIDKILSIELDEKRFLALENNVHVSLYDHTHIKLVNGNFIEVFDNLKTEISDIILFIDPPWGGSSYQEYEKVDDLYLTYKGTKYGIEDLIKRCKGDKSIGKRIRMIIFKLPYNINMKRFEKFKNLLMIKKNKVLYVSIVFEIS